MPAQIVTECQHSDRRRASSQSETVPDRDSSQACTRRQRERYLRIIILNYSWYSRSPREIELQIEVFDDLRVSGRIGPTRHH